eukprot:m.65561 g.65561  ORF g.65561 m.65561 type:complete len:282 (-) comp13674_c0_seq3:112-957(-)
MESCRRTPCPLVVSATDRGFGRHIAQIDCSGIIEQAKTIVKANGFGDVITLIRGKVEEVELPVDKVDVIISEWMGYCLFYESMLDTVLYARDKWLVPGGVLLPDKASIVMSSIEDAEYKDNKINWWDDVYGFDMSCIKELALKEPLVDIVDPKQINSDFDSCFAVDINTVTKPELAFSAPFTLRVRRDDYIHALVAHFDIEFSRCHKGVAFSTGALHTYTHWKQTVFYLPETLTVKEGEVLTGILSCKPNEHNPRDLDLVLKVKFEGELSSCDVEVSYRMR